MNIPRRFVLLIATACLLGCAPNTPAIVADVADDRHAHEREDAFHSDDTAGSDEIDLAVAEMTQFDEEPPMGSSFTSFHEADDACEAEVTAAFALEHVLLTGSVEVKGEMPEEHPLVVATNIDTGSTYYSRFDYHEFSFMVPKGAYRIGLEFQNSWCGTCQDLSIVESTWVDGSLDLARDLEFATTSVELTLNDAPLPGEDMYVRPGHIYFFDTRSSFQTRTAVNTDGTATAQLPKGVLFDAYWVTDANTLPQQTTTRLPIGSTYLGELSAGAQEVFHFNAKSREVGDLTLRFDGQPLPDYDNVSRGSRGTLTLEKMFDERLRAVSLEIGNFGEPTFDLHVFDDGQEHQLKLYVWSPDWAERAGIRDSEQIHRTGPLEDIFDLPFPKVHRVSGTITRDFPFECSVVVSATSPGVLPQEAQVQADGGFELYLREGTHEVRAMPQGRLSDCPRGVAVLDSELRVDGPLERDAFHVSSSRIEVELLANGAPIGDDLVADDFRGSLNFGPEVVTEELDVSGPARVELWLLDGEYPVTLSTMSDHGRLGFGPPVEQETLPPGVVELGRLLVAGDARIEVPLSLAEVTLELENMTQVELIGVGATSRLELDSSETGLIPFGTYAVRWFQPYSEPKATVGTLIVGCQE